MRTLALLLAGLVLTAAAPAPPQPVVVEIFTSQGCSSCPPSDAAIARVADRPDVIALSFGVTYWDHLGWKDTFAKPEFTERQYAYARALGGDPYTPEVVAGGRYAGVGGSPAAILGLVIKARTPALTTVQGKGATVEIGSGVVPRSGADVWLVRYDPRTVQVPVKAGENIGKTLPIRNVVRQLKRLGPWTGAPVGYDLPPAPAGLASVVLVQAKKGGPILAAGRL